MVLLVLLSGALLVVLPGMARRAGRRLAPREWSLLCALALAGGALLIEVGTVLLAAPSVLLALGAPGLASACERLIGPLLPGGPLLGMVAVPPAITMPFLAVLGLRRAGRHRRQFEVDPSVGSHLGWRGIDVVLLPTADLLAFSVQGDHPQILVSVGMIDTLSPGELEAVLGHEHAHLRFRHHRLLVLATMIDSGLPLARRSTATLRTALERWADEASVADDGRARATLRAALLQASCAPTNPLHAAFSPLETVVERIDALGRPPSRPSWTRRGLLYSPGLVIAILAVGASTSWLSDVNLLIAMAGHCPV